MADMRQIESELEQLLQSDKASWVRIYELIAEVEKGQLWQGAYRSFTAWVRGLAARVQVHESLIWSRKKAGSVYAEYAQRIRDRGDEVEDMSSLSVSPDSLIFCEKIARGDEKIKDELISKAIKGDLTRADLKQAWEVRRAALEERGIKPVRSNSYVELEPEGDSEGSEAEKSMTAADVVLALSRPEWLGRSSEDQPQYKKMVYRALPEFPVRTGSSHHARRIDLLLIENYSLDADDMVALHGIEIKVSRSDLLNDHKTSEYMDFVDYLWFAVPEDLVEDALDVAGYAWGVISVTPDRGVKVVQNPAQHDPIRRDKTLNMALIKLL